MRCPIFQGLDIGQLAAIAGIAERATASIGQVIARTGEAAVGAILIVNGTALSKRGPDTSAPVRKLEAGALVGELAMLVETTFAATVTAATPLRLMKIARADLYRLMQGEGRIAAHFASKIGERLQSLVAEVRQIEAGIGKDMQDPGHQPMPPRSSQPMRVFPPPRPQLPPTYVPDAAKLQLSK
jgi:CRP-like cAMP-binding protein